MQNNQTITAVNLLIDKLENFYRQESDWYLVINNVNGKYSSDFSVLLTQNVIDTLENFHNGKEDVLKAILNLIQVISLQQTEYPSAVLLLVDEIKNNAQKIAKISFVDKFYAYGKATNEIIAFFNTAEGQVHENRIIEANKLLKLWNSVILAIKETSEYIELIRKDTISLSSAIYY